MVISNRGAPEFRTRAGAASRMQVPAAELSTTMMRLDALATVMDSAITIPGTNVTMGLDALLGLLPVVGDAIAGVISSYIIWEARRIGAPKFLLARMAGNVAIDTVIGSIPFAGDIFDVAFKSNRKNVALLQRHLDKHGVRDSNTIDASYRVG